MRRAAERDRSRPWGLRGGRSPSQAPLPPAGSTPDMAAVAEEVARLRGTRPSTLKDLLTDRSFSRLWRAMLVSSLGDWVGFVAVAALVARLAGARLGGLAVAGVMLARLLPSVLFGPFAGVLADRYDRRTLMVGADLARGALYASMPFLSDLWAIFGLSFAIECLSLLWTPAKDASVPNLVPRRQLANANSVGLITTYGTLPLGATVFTALTGVAVTIGHRVGYLGRHPEFLALWLDALTFFFSATMVWRLDLRPGAAVRTHRKDRPPAMQELREGYRFLRSHPLVRAMTLGIVIAFAGVGSVISLGPVFARYVVHAGSAGFGVLMTAFGIGMGAGMALINPATRYLEKEKVFPLAMLAAAGSLFVVALTPRIQLAALFTIPMGLGSGLTWVVGYTMLQENVQDEFRGRTFATLTISARMALFIALAGFPALSALLGRGFAIGSLQLDGTRLSLILGAGVAAFAAILSRTGLARFRVAKPRRLRIVPRLLKPEHRGLLVAFEGVEGAGKGTQIRLADRYLRDRGRKVLLTREPGGTELGERVRTMLLDRSTGSMSPRTEALLFAACRAELVERVIRPALEEGTVVLCDRFVDSSVAYQGVARGLGEEDVLNLNAWTTQGLFPDLVILLHLDPAAGLARANAANEGADRIESEDMAFHSKVSDAYLKIAEEHPERFRVIDASQPPDRVEAAVRAALDEALSRTEREDRSGAT